jgi:hypothetical protein
VIPVSRRRKTLHRSRPLVSYATADGDGVYNEPTYLFLNSGGPCSLCEMFGGASTTHARHRATLAENEEEAPTAIGAPSGHTPAHTGGSRERLQRTHQT